MANIDSPNGFTPIGTLSGSPWAASVQAFELDGGHLAVGVGDLMTMTAAGTLEQFAAGDAQCVGVMVGIVPAGAGWNAASGIFGDNSMSATEPTLTGANSRSVPANTAATILVATAPDLIMVCQEDGETDGLELLDVGSNIEIVGTTPNTTTGNSVMELNSDTHATTATLPLRLLGLHNVPGNEFGGATNATQWAKWKVTFANHAYSGISVGI